jgi:diguanylate cyclase (GGDEF)-like protein
MNEISTRSLTVAYCLALAIVAALSFLSHVTLNGILQEQEGSAAIINISGRQTMLSQQVASLASQYAAGDASRRAELSEAADTFEKFHRALDYGDATLHIPAPESAALIAIYADTFGKLDATALAYAARARKIAGMQTSDPTFRTEVAWLLADETPLLKLLERVVAFHAGASEAQLGKLRLLQSGSLIVVLLTLVAEAMGIFRPMVAKIQKYTSELLRIANRDPLTGVFNRKGFTDHALTELARARRYRRPTSLLMIDADNFKAINDAYGHAAGDTVLRAIASAIGASLRPADILSRLGGEEFGVLLPETALAGATAAAERIRRRVEAHTVNLPAGPVEFTISIGVTQMESAALALDAAMGRADAALYRAKGEGRNRVVAIEAPPVVMEVALTSAA